MTILKGLLPLRLFYDLGLEGMVGRYDWDVMSAPDQIISVLQSGGGTQCSVCGAEVITLEDFDITERPRLSHSMNLVGDPAVYRQRLDRNGRSWRFRVR